MSANCKLIVDGLHTTDKSGNEGTAANFVVKHFDEVKNLVEGAAKTFVEKLEKSEGNPKQLTPVLKEIDGYLTLRTFLVGYSFSPSDAAVWNAIQACGLKNKTTWNMLARFSNLNRWLTFLEAHPLFQVMIALYYAEARPSKAKKAEKKATATKATKAKANTAKYGATGKFTELENAVKGKVCTRFPPEPSGYLHVGHLKAILLNYQYARDYDGKMLVRFDDTNPSKEKEEYVANILSDLKEMNIVHEPISYTSDHFPRIIKCCTKLLNDGIFYVDETEQEKMQQERAEGIESQYRERPKKENLQLWADMQKGTDRGMTCCVRAKIDMQNKNCVLRDPVMFRCNATPHHRTGTKYKVYPMYDFACPIVDSVEGVSHALRTKEYTDRKDLYYWILDVLKLPHRPNITVYGRLGFSFTVLSKRKLQWFVDNKKVSGWDSPAFPTIQGILRRGMDKQVLCEYINSQGGGKTEVNIDMNKLWAINMKTIDRRIPRHTAIGENFVCVNLDNAKTEHKEVAAHKKNPELGKLIVSYCNKILIEAADAATLAEEEEITLMNWGNCIIKKINKENDKITSIDATLHLEGDFKKTKKKMHWLANDDEFVQLQLNDYAPLIKKAKISPVDLIEEVANDQIEFITTAKGDANMRLLQKGDRLQLVRRGFFIVDKPYVNATQPIVLIEFPDGKEKGMSDAK